MVGVTFLGMGNGSVFQLVPQRFRTNIGVATGIVGACGGVGGFLLPLILGGFKQTTGSYAAGWGILALVALVALVVLRILVIARLGWHTSWSSEAPVVTETVEKVLVHE